MFDTGAWYKQSQVSKTKQIDKNKEINEYSDPYNIFGEFLGDYTIFPNIGEVVKLSERYMELDFEKNLPIEELNFTFAKSSWVFLNGVSFEMYYMKTNDDRKYTEVV